MKVTKEAETKLGFCQCGRPLHYSQQSVKATVDRIVGNGNQFVTVEVFGGGKFRVQRHFIALHGFSAQIAKDYGFESS